MRKTRGRATYDLLLQSLRAAVSTCYVNSHDFNVNIKPESNGQIVVQFARVQSNFILLPTCFVGPSDVSRVPSPNLLIFPRRSQKACDRYLPAYLPLSQGT